MYKKITHQIVEEHFASPNQLIGTEIPTPQPIIPKPHPNGTLYDTEPSYYEYIIEDGSLGLNDELPQYVLNEDTMLFRMNCRTAWTKWAYSLMNYAISLNADLPGTEQVKGRMHKNAIAIGDMLVPYYGPTSAKLLGTSLIAIDDVGMRYVEALKKKESTDDIVASWAPLVDDFANVLNELNPNNWPVSLITDIMLALVQAWQDQLTARANEDITADEIAIDTISKLVATGIPDHGKGYDSLSDIFSRGIIAQFPSKFQE